MDLITPASQWVKGEIIQGRIGFGMGILMAIAFLYFANFQQSFFKGMILPFVVLQLILLGYSSYQMVMRPKHMASLEHSLSISSQVTLDEELERSQKEDKVFRTLRPIWAVLFLVSLILFLLLGNIFFKGMSLGFIVFFSVAYTYDTFLHLRLKTYLSALLDL